MFATKFGLIGHPLGHSLSPFIHQGILHAADLPGTYRLYDIPADQLAETVRRLSTEITGFNCTIPYKEAVIPYLDTLDQTAARIRAVNTIMGKCGYNTDYAAFRHVCPLEQGQFTLILGAGGVSRNMAFAAAAAGCRLWIVSRRPDQAVALAKDIQRFYPSAKIICPPSLADWRRSAESCFAGKRHWIVLNGTPVGMWPHVSGMPLQKSDLAYASRVYDTIYNPVATRLVLAARSLGIPADGGQGMLFHQALAAQKIWHPQAVFPEQAMRQVQRNLALAIIRQSPLSILLCGFMGSGKTTIGRQLARRLGMLFLDLDEVIEEKAGCSIPDIFANDGEQGFRVLERAVLQQALARPESKVLATGGGALLGEGIETLRQDHPALIVWLDVTLATALGRVGKGEGRPMLTDRDETARSQLYRQRRPRYQAVADLMVNGNHSPDQVIRETIQKLGLEEIS